MSVLDGCSSLKLLQLQDTCFHEANTAAEIQNEEDEYDAEFWSHQFPSYQFLTLLSETQSSLVWLGTPKNSNEKIALKIMAKIQTECSMKYHQEEQLKFVRSFNLHSMAKIGSIEQNSQYILFVMKYYCHGDLTNSSKYFSNPKRRFTSIHIQFVVFIFKILVSAVHQIHSTGYVHRDLKLDNFLIDQNYHIFVSDFGLVIKQMSIDKSLCGTIQYIAPERLSKSREHQPIRRSSDIWALGIIFYELLTGKTPFNGQNADQILEQICEDNIRSKQIPLQAMSLLKSMLEINQFKRTNIDSILSHPFLNVTIQQLELRKILESIH